MKTARLALCRTGRFSFRQQTLTIRLDGRALEAAHAGVPLYLTANGTGFATEFPFLIDHRRPPIGVLAVTDWDATTFTFSGCCEPQYRDELFTPIFLSLRVQPRAAYLHAGPGMPVGFIPESFFSEPGAVADPFMAGSFCFVSETPELVPPGERFEIASDADGGNGSICRGHEISTE